ncbi:beta-catenin-like protein 1, partial [Xyrauchen texanus]|uniref:beta-catenin-like protein 1 n=1 Tax=Xyrauchen texanus TaxID=154827 RepID=UPI00224221A8
MVLGSRLLFPVCNDDKSFPGAELGDNTLISDLSSAPLILSLSLRLYSSPKALYSATNNTPLFPLLVAVLPGVTLKTCDITDLTERFLLPSLDDCVPSVYPQKHICSIIASMLRNLKAQQRGRLLSKFTENDCEKVDRLMELHFKYLDAVQLADKRIEGEKHDLVRRGEIIDDVMDDEFYLRRLDAGLFVLQLICYIMVEICNAGISQLQQRVHQILNIRGGSVKVVRHIMR